MIIALFKNNYKKIELNMSGQKEPSLMIVPHDSLMIRLQNYMKR